MTPYYFLRMCIALLGTSKRLSLRLISSIFTKSNTGQASLARARPVAGRSPMATAGSNRGFTLIETIIYLALYALIMTGVLVSVYGIFGSASRNQTKAIVQEEGSYLVGKIDWALTGVQSISLPATNASGDSLTVTKYDTTVGNPIVISVSGGNLTIKRGSGAVHVLNNTNTQVSCAAGGCFTHVAASGDGINPESLAASFVISATTSEGLAFSQPFATVKYLRK